MTKRAPSRAGLRMRQRNHVIKRCAERYGIVLTLDDYVRLCDRVWAYMSGLTMRWRGVERVEGFSRPMLFIWYRDTLMLVSWNEKTLQITTFLSRADQITDRERVIAIRNTPMHRRWKTARDYAQVASPEI